MKSIIRNGRRKSTQHSHPGWGYWGDICCGTLLFGAVDIGVAKFDRLCICVLGCNLLSKMFVEDRNGLVWGGGFDKLLVGKADEKRGDVFPSCRNNLTFQSFPWHGNSH